MFTSYELSAPMRFGFDSRMNTPLFVVGSAQNSARSWKSLYELFDTRNPPRPR
jgi:hypothetical protein